MAGEGVVTTGVETDDVIGIIYDDIMGGDIIPPESSVVLISADIVMDEDMCRDVLALTESSTLEDSDCLNDDVIGVIDDIISGDVIEVLIGACSSIDVTIIVDVTNDVITIGLKITSVVSNSNTSLVGINKVPLPSPEASLPRCLYRAIVNRV